MNTRNFYVNKLLPAYRDMLISLDNDSVGSGKLKRSVEEVCGYCNDLIDYVVIEHPQYIKDNFSVDNAKDFRTKLESSTQLIGNIHVDGFYFGYIRDVANTSKHSKIGRPDAKVSSTEKVCEGIAQIRHQDADGYYYSSRQAVIVDGENGARILIELFIYLCLYAFTNLLVEIGVIPSMPKEPINKREFHLSRTKAKSYNHIPLEGSAGEPFRYLLGAYISEPDQLGLLNIRNLQPEDYFEYTTNLSSKVGPRLF